MHKCISVYVCLTYHRVLSKKTPISRYVRQINVIFKHICWTPHILSLNWLWYVHEQISHKIGYLVNVGNNVIIKLQNSERNMFAEFKKLFCNFNDYYICSQPSSFIAISDLLCKYAIHLKNVRRLVCRWCKDVIVIRDTVRRNSTYKFLFLEVYFIYLLK